MTTNHSSLSRRAFLRLSAVSLGTLAGGRLLSACSKMPGSATAAPSPTATEAATATALPSATATTAATATASVPISRDSLPEIMKFFPVAPSKVIQTHHAGVWSDKTLVPGALRQMLDASITKLTGLNDAREAWAALFKPGERIAIKVNTFRNSRIWTHPALVLEITNSLQSAGIPAEQITIFDYQSSELETAGYTLNADSPGVRCTGVEQNFSKELTSVMKNKIYLANIFKECDALINIPILKSHMMAGITFAMKNHYGSIYYPDMLHADIVHSIAALNALPEIKDRTRLIIGDALSANLRYSNSYPYWKEDWIGDSIFMSYDPVAHDTMGLQLLTRELEKAGGNPASLIGMAAPTMQYAAELGLGTNDPANMQVIEQSLA